MAQTFSSLAPLLGFPSTDARGAIFFLGIDYFGGRSGESTISAGDRGAVPFNRTNPPSRLDPVTVVQPESNAVSDRTQEGDKGQLKTRPKELRDTGLPEAKNSQSSCDVDTALLEIANRQPLRELNGTNEDPLEPILTPDTYLLTIHAGKAIWTQLGTIAIGTTVVQSLPSGQTEDLGGALVTTIESICPCQRPTGGAALVRLGMACVAAHLHIK